MSNQKNINKYQTNFSPWPDCWYCWCLEGKQNVAEQKTTISSWALVLFIFLTCLLMSTFFFLKFWGKEVFFLLPENEALFSDGIESKRTLRCLQEVKVRLAKRKKIWSCVEFSCQILVSLFVESPLFVFVFFFDRCSTSHFVMGGHAHWKGEVKKKVQQKFVALSSLSPPLSFFLFFFFKLNSSNTS